MLSLPAFLVFFRNQGTPQAIDLFLLQCTLLFLLQ